jgi:hypothetical protein
MNHITEAHLLKLNLIMLGWLEAKDHSWLETAASQIRDWRSEDERNGQPWDNSSREAAVSLTSGRPHNHGD